MTEAGFSGVWTIRASTSRFFPVHSTVELKPQPSKSDGFELAVVWEGYATLKLIEKDLLQEGNGALKGRFGYPKEPREKPPEEFQLVVTLCPADGPKREKYLFGLLFPVTGGVGDEGTGVWVAEAKPKDPSCGST